MILQSIYSNDNIKLKSDIMYISKEFPFNKTYTFHKILFQWLKFATDNQYYILMGIIYKKYNDIMLSNLNTTFDILYSDDKEFTYYLFLQIYSENAKKFIENISEKNCYRLMQMAIINTNTTFFEYIIRIILIIIRKRRADTFNEGPKL